MGPIDSVPVPPIKEGSSKDRHDVMVIALYYYPLPTAELKVLFSLSCPLEIRCNARLQLDEVERSMQLGIC